VQTGVEAKREKAREPEVNFLPQDRVTTEYSTFSETGMLAVEIQHRNLFEIDDAVKLMRLFLREKDETIASGWPKKRLKEFVVSQLQATGQNDTFLRQENLLGLQQSLGTTFREPDREHSRLSQTVQEIVSVNLTAVQRQSFSEGMLKEHGSLWTVNG
jgi:type III restriction enzyme